MGACATKPKVAKDGDLAPVLRPEHEKEAVAAAAEVSAVVKAENVHPVLSEENKEKEKTVDKVKEIVDDDNQTTKRPSLSNLLKENEQAEELAESEATTNREKQESTETQNPIIEERSVPLIPIEEVKQSEPVERAKPEQLETETLKGMQQSIAEKSVDQPEKQEEKPMQNTEEKQQNIVTEEKPAEETQVTILTEKSVDPEEKLVIVTEKTLEPIEKQESNVTEFETPTAQAVVDASAATVFEKVIESKAAIEVNSSQPEKEKKTEEAK